MSNPKSKTQNLKSEDLYQLLFDTALDAVVVIDENGPVINWNSQAETMFGWTESEMIGQQLSDTIIPPQYRQAHQQGLKRFLATGQGQVTNKRVEITGLHRDGREFPIELSISSLRQGERWIFSAFIRDISKQTQAEEQLRKLSQAVEQSASSVLITNARGKIEYANPRFTQLTGYTAQEVIGKDPSILKSGKTSPEEYKKLWDTIGSGDEWLGEFHNRRKNGELYWVSASISPIKNSDGVITHFLGIEEDITERKQLEEERRVRYRQEHILSTLLQIGLENVTLDEQLEQILQGILAIPWLPLNPKGGIFLVEEESDVLELKVQQGLAPDLLTICARVPFGRCLCGQAAASRQIVFADCVNERHQNTYDGIIEHGHYNVPILSGQKVLGVIVLYLPAGYQKKEQEETFLQTIANTLAGIIRRKQLEQHVQESLMRRERQVRTSTEIAKQIAAAPALDELFKQVVDLVWERFGYYHVRIYTLEQNDLVIQAGMGQAGHEGQYIDQQITLTTKQSLIAQSARTGQPVLAPDVSKAPDWISDPQLPDTKAEIAVPIKLEQTVLGVLDVQNNAVGSLSQEDQLALLGLCGQIAVAIDSHRVEAERKQAETELRRLDWAIRQSMEGMAIADLDGNIQFVNLAWARAHGYEPEELQGKHLSIFHTQEQLRNEVAPFNEQVTLNGANQGEVGHMRKNGSTFPTWMSVTLLKDASGQPMGLAAAAQDITERKLAASEL